MNQINPKVWSLLKEDEKVAMGLQHVMNKSSWEAGEILERSHYKYLEIKYRAEKFIVLFTEHINLYDEVIPRECSGEKVVLEYFRICLEERKKPKDVMNTLKWYWPDIEKEKLEEKIIKHFKSWSNPEINAHDFQLFNLIKDFDRWNNFRILPRDLQEPSAFKRRLKNVYKRHIKLITSIPKLSIKKIVEFCENKSPRTPKLYLPLMDGIQKRVIRVRNTKPVVELLTELSFYLFKDENLAREYLENIEEYVYTSKSCRDGQKFWPTYREMIKKAHNYNIVHNITPTRKYLDVALQKLEFI